MLNMEGFQGSWMKKTGSQWSEETKWVDERLLKEKKEGKMKLTRGWPLMAHPGGGGVWEEGFYTKTCRNVTLIRGNLNTSKFQGKSQAQNMRHRVKKEKKCTENERGVAGGILKSRQENVGQCWTLLAETKNSGLGIDDGISNELYNVYRTT